MSIEFQVSSRGASLPSHREPRHIRDNLISHSPKLCQGPDTKRRRSRHGAVGREDGRRRRLESCAGILKFARCQIGQGLERHIRNIQLGRQCHQGDPVRRRDAPRLPAAHGGIRLLERTSDRTSPAECHND